MQDITSQGGTAGKRLATLLRQNARQTLNAAVMAMALAVPTASFATGQIQGVYLAPKFTSEPPAGALDLCVRYNWACSGKGNVRSFSPNDLPLAKKINLQINRTVRQINDDRQYGRKDYWTLPSKRGGDCEDLALLKKAALLQQGLASERLLIATVLDRRGNNHAVLVLRTDSGDYILDNLTNRVQLWSKTKYSFLKMQDPDAPHKWRAVLAGGVFN